MNVGPGKVVSADHLICGDVFQMNGATFLVMDFVKYMPDGCTLIYDVVGWAIDAVAGRQVYTTSVYLDKTQGVSLL